MASAMRNKASSAGANASSCPSRIAVISSSLRPYILPPAEFASIQNGHPTRIAVRNVSSIRCRCGTAAFCPSSHSASAFIQNTRDTRAAISCGVRSRPNILRTFLKTCRIRNDVCWGSMPSTLAMKRYADESHCTYAPGLVHRDNRSRAAGTSCPDRSGSLSGPKKSFKTIALGPRRSSPVTSFRFPL